MKTSTDPQKVLRFVVWSREKTTKFRTKHKVQRTKFSALVCVIGVICGLFSDMATVARKFLIKGDVQGVGYRFFAQRAAARHQVVGYVRNLPDGTVEVLAEGSANSVESFKHDLATGPQWATVSQIEEIDLDPSGMYPSFRVER